MAIKKKISRGFVVIATILLVSSALSIYEFIRMRNTVSNLINDNISSINTSRQMLEVTDEYNFNLLRGLGDEHWILNFKSPDDNRFSEHLSNVRDNFTTQLEKDYADSVLYAYTSYIWIMNDAPTVWHGDYTGRRNWYFNKLHPVYMQLRNYLQKLTNTSQQALAENSLTMTESFYRSIMPGVVAVIMGIILVFLFNYFINYYFVNPLLKISEGISNYLERKKSYIVTIDNDDELKDLNDNVRELVEANKKLSKLG